MTASERERPAGKTDGSSGNHEGVNGDPLCLILSSAFNISCSVLSSPRFFSVAVVVTVGNFRPSSSVKAHQLKGLGIGIKEI